MGRFSGADGIGVLWLKREDYARFLALVDRNDWQLDTFEEWEQATKKAIAFIESEGGRVVRVEADPDQLLTWCSIRGLKLDSTGRQMFASDPANWPASQKH